MTTILEKIDKVFGGNGRKVFNKFIIHKTKEYQKKYGFDIGDGNNTHNNEADAFKHAYMQWVLGYYFGEDIAKKLGDMHEDETPNAPAGETNMDKWNNKIGREIANEMKNQKEDISTESASDRAARIIMEKMKNGEIIVSPDDKRKYENMDLERLKESDRVYYKGEFKGAITDEEMEHYMNQAIENDWNIPEKTEIDKRVNSGELIYVNNYTKSDGTKVSGYYRKRPSI